MAGRRLLGATVLFNDGQGHLANATTLQLGSAGGAAPIHAKADATAQLVAVGPDGATLYSLMPGTRTFDGGVPLAVGGTLRDRHRRCRVRRRQWRWCR